MIAGMKKSQILIGMISALTLGMSAGAQTQQYAADALVYLGPAGTYSDMVAQEVGAKYGFKPVTATSITEVSNLVSSGRTPYGLIPVENSSGGYVAETLTLLSKTPGWKIMDVVDLPIDNTLLANPGTRLADITTIISHPQPFLQSASYLKTNFANVKRVEVKSTAAAAEAVAALAGTPEGRTTAALAAPGAGPLYRLEALGTRTQDDKSNTTRFLVVQHAPLPAGAKVNHAVVLTNDLSDQRRLLLGMQASGMNLVGAASTPAGSLGHQTMTLFFSGREVQQQTLQGVVNVNPGSLLIGAYMKPAQNPDSETLAALKAICPKFESSAPGQQRLTVLTTCRLNIADDVAMAKYNSGAAIEDVVREKAVIDNAIQALPQIDADFVTRYFRAQIEASKVVQNQRVSSWKAANQPKFVGAPDLVKDVRPKLDLLQQEIQRALSFVWAAQDCVVPISSDATLQSALNSQNPCVVSK